MLVNCVSYKNGYKLHDLSVHQISEALKDPDCFVWVAIKDTDKEEITKISQEFNIHHLALEDAINGNQRPKIEEYSDSLFVVLHTVDFDHNKNLHVGEVDIFVGKNYILSVRNKTRQGFTTVRERCEREPELLKMGSSFVLYVLMDTVVDRYFPIIDELERQLEIIEEKIFSKTSSTRTVVEEVYNLKSKLLILQHTVASLLELVGKLHGTRVPHLCLGMQEYFRDVSDHVIRMSKSIESIREMTATVIQVNFSLITLAETEVTKNLAAYGALFACPTLIAGIYGMNFQNMPELNFHLGYPISLAIMTLADLFLWWRFKKARWL
ncbi:MAG: magnesium/cobalt transporter CorA [Oligoflexales bacterium]|nr:magnesium/cobalt transporter CorA [Oligoflexales bacterium]